MHALHNDFGFRAAAVREWEWEGAQWLRNTNTWQYGKRLVAATPMPQKHISGAFASPCWWYACEQMNVVKYFQRSWQFIEHEHTFFITFLGRHRCCHLCYDCNYQFFFRFFIVRFTVVAVCTWIIYNFMYLHLKYSGPSMAFVREWCFHLFQFIQIQNHMHKNVRRNRWKSKRWKRTPGRLQPTSYYCGYGQWSFDNSRNVILFWEINLSLNGIGVELHVKILFCVHWVNCCCCTYT